MLQQMSRVRPAERTENLGFSDIVKIRNRVLALQQEGAPVIRLEGGEPFPPTPDFVKAAMKDALDRDQTRYAPSSGIPPLLDAIREKLVRHNGLTVERSNLIVCSGGAHGIFCAFQTVLGPGEEALVFSPFWTPIRDQIRYCGGVPVFIPWSEVREGDLEEVLTSRITPRTRMLYLNSPSNPSGDVFDREHLEIIARVAMRHDLVVISDEAYEDFSYEIPRTSIATLPEMFPRTISIFTMSKSFSMTGWRCGYIVADEMWMDPIRRLVLNTTNGVSTPTQWAARAAVAEGDAYLEQMRPEYRKRRDLLVEGVHQAGFGSLTPRGAFYLFVDVRERLGADSWKAMNDLLDRTGIATVPGVVFGNEGEGYLRMSYSNPIETLEKAVEALSRLD